MAYLPRIDDPSIFCDSSVFSTIDIESTSSSFSPLMTTNEANSSHPRNKKKQASSPATAFPILPASHNFSALGNPDKFQAYITTQLPLANAGCVGGLASPPPELVCSDQVPNKINSQFFRGMLKGVDKMCTTEMNWIEKTVFPNRVLPVDFQEDKVRIDPMFWETAGHSSVAQSDSGNGNEPLVEDWLNNLANNLAAAHNFKNLPSIKRSDRSFDCRTARRAAQGSFMGLKPDICLINRTLRHNLSKTPEKRLHWRNVYAFIEVTQADTQRLSEMLKQVQQKSMCLFDVQPQRRFCFALAIFGKPPNIFFNFIMVDRSGMVYTKPVPLKSYSASTFCRIIFGLCYCGPDVLGWDLAIRVNPSTGEVISIDVTGFLEDTGVIQTRTFQIIRLLHSSPILYGRGTKVWIVKDEQGRFFILKDSWTLANRTVSEVDFIQHITRTIQDDPDGYLFKYICPRYYIGQEQVWSTETIRGQLDKGPIRIQRRIVTGPIGDPITSFRSKREFVSVLLDIVNGMSFAHVDDEHF